ncbi:MAG: maleylpyruvate isomerase N-terminal domain-containing protein [Dehalococcoidia bacterium]|nr:maleylpyruvate isomerase N-terminal domain-containing protein [Dehalococcoidia bacterium]
MTTREEFIAAVQQVDERLAALREQIVAGGEKPLQEGTWRVRDALSHLAARSNGVARVLARVEAADNPSATPPAPRNIDEINAGQVEERTDRSVEELLDEIAAGHAAAIEAARGLDDETLARSLPLGFRPGDATVAELLAMGGPRHDGNHLDQVEAALKA